MKVACFCGTVFDAEPPVGMCPNCEAPPVISAMSGAEAAELSAAYNEGLDAIRRLPEVGAAIRKGS